MTWLYVICSFAAGVLVGALAVRQGVVVKGPQFELRAGSVPELRRLLLAIHVPTADIFKGPVQ